MPYVSTSVALPSGVQSLLQVGPLIISPNEQMD